MSTPSPMKDLGETEDVRAGIAPINESEAGVAIKIPAINITLPTLHPPPCHDTQEKEERLLAPAPGAPAMENAMEDMRGSPR